MIKCCIFDLDGTILDTLSTLTHFVNVTLQNHGISEITEDECRYFVGDGAKNLIERALKSKGIVDEQLRDTLFLDFIKSYNNDSLYLTRPFEGICDLLSILKERGIALAVLTNKPHSTTEPLINHFFGGVFDIVYGAREGVSLKPDPSSAREILHTLSISENETAFIGDSSVDIKTGKNLGVALTVGVLWGLRDRDELEAEGADLIVSSADQIFKAVNAYD